jgi:hypothetical protein
VSAPTDSLRAAPTPRALEQHDRQEKRGATRRNEPEQYRDKLLTLPPAERVIVSSRLNYEARCKPRAARIQAAYVTAVTEAAAMSAGQKAKPNSDATGTATKKTRDGITSHKIEQESALTSAMSLQSRYSQIIARIDVSGSDTISAPNNDERRATSLAAR